MKFSLKNIRTDLADFCLLILLIWIFIAYNMMKFLLSLQNENQLKPIKCCKETRKGFCFDVRVDMKKRNDFNTFKEYARRINVRKKNSDSFYCELIKKYCLDCGFIQDTLSEFTVWLSLPGANLLSTKKIKEEKYVLNLHIEINSMPEILKKCYKMVDMIILKIKVIAISKIDNEKVEKDIYSCHFVDFSNNCSSIMLDIDFSNNIFHYSFSISHISVYFSSFGLERESIQRKLVKNYNLYHFVTNPDVLKNLTILMSTIKRYCSSKINRSGENHDDSIDQYYRTVQRDPTDCNNNDTSYSINIEELFEQIFSYCSNFDFKNNKFCLIISTLLNRSELNKLKLARKKFDSLELKFFKDIYSDNSLIDDIKQLFSTSDEKLLIILFLFINNIEGDELTAYMNTITTLTQLIGETLS